MTFRDIKTPLDLTYLCDDGSDISPASNEVAEKAFLQFIGKFDSFKAVQVEVELKKTRDIPLVKFPFSRAWTVLINVLHLSAGQMALKNILHLVSDD